ncbi:MAG: hypothetical protein MAG453_01873 [Calditrichaeota bacterium]|nr:hypothetical protein [Calditrichota bacterium]
MPANDHENPRVFFLTRGGPTFPSSRFRVYQYAELFARDKIPIVIAHENRNDLARLALFVRHRRARTLFIQKKLLHRWELPIIRRLYDRVVYDFDDAMGLPSAFKNESPRKLRRTLRRLRRMTQFADMVVCCNQTLCRLSGRPDAVLIPTPYTPPPASNTAERPLLPARILWVGMDMKKLLLWEEPLAEIAEQHEVEITVCSHKDRPLEFRFPFEYVRWSLAEERRLLNTCTIGLMPLPDDENSKGKCGFKILQYMAHGLLPVASDVGFNREIVRNGRDGFLCSGAGEFRETLARVLAGNVAWDGIRENAFARAREFSTERMYDRLKEVLAL